MRLYHGTPYGYFDFADYVGEYAFFTTSKEVAREYTRALIQSGKKPEGAKIGPTILEVDVTLATGSIFNTAREPDRTLYTRLVRQARAALPDDDWPSGQLMVTYLDEYTSVLLPPWSDVKTLMPYIIDEGFRAAWVSEGSQGASLVVHHPQDVVRPA